MSKAASIPWLLILLLISCADSTSPGTSSLMKVPIQLRVSRDPSPEQILKDVSAIVDGMERAHGYSAYSRR